MILVKIILIGYVIPVIAGIVMMILFEYLVSRLKYGYYSCKDISPLVFFPLINWILIPILPFGIIIFGCEYLGDKLQKLLNKI